LKEKTKGNNILFFHLFIQLNKRNISSLSFLFYLCYFDH